MIVEKLVRAELIYTDNHRTTYEKDMESKYKWDYNQYI